MITINTIDFFFLYSLLLYQRFIDSSWRLLRKKINFMKQLKYGYLSIRQIFNPSNFISSSQPLLCLFLSNDYRRLILYDQFVKSFLKICKMILFISIPFLFLLILSSSIVFAKLTIYYTAYQTSFPYVTSCLW